MPESEGHFDSSTPYSPSSSYHSIMQEQDLSDNESMVISVESSPYSLPSPSSRLLKRKHSDFELSTRKGRCMTGEELVGEYQDATPKKWTTHLTRRSNLHHDVDDYHVLHSSRLHMIEDPVPPSQAIGASSKTAVPELSWRSLRGVWGAPSTSVQCQMPKLHEPTHEIQNSNSPVPRTCSALEKQVKTLGQSHMSPREVISQETIQEVRGLEPQTEALVQYHRAGYDRATSASNDGRIKDSDNDADETVAWQSHLLSTGAILATPDDSQRHKRWQPSSTISYSETDHSFHQVSCTSTTPPSTSNSTTPPASIATQAEIENFLSSLTATIHASTLQSLCPDNMRGTFCHNPSKCHSQGRFFACPEYAILKKCPHEQSNCFTHFGHKHTVNACTAHHKIECKRTHQDGRACRVQVVYFHVRASCITLRGGSSCQMRPCRWGHDFGAIRRAVMKR